MKPVVFKVLNNKGAGVSLEDTTNGQTYTGTVYPKGHTLPRVGLRANDSLVFLDDKFDVVVLNLDNALAQSLIQITSLRKDRSPSGNSGSRKQYSVTFKRRTAAAIVKLQESGKRYGGISKYLSGVGVPYPTAHTWVSQYKEGTLRKRNAISVSSSPSKLIKG